MSHAIAALAWRASAACWDVVVIVDVVVTAPGRPTVVTVKIVIVVAFAARHQNSSLIGCKL
jgi:hypothetical protein